jgi:bifunctional non-homologous end joining protein LigD
MADTALREYHQKRNFTRTKEPRGSRKKPSKGNLFVVHKHDARRLHYDLRLELDGVLKSWAVTKGPSLSPGDKRLAVRTEDHPLEYAEFEGRIPEGEYGAGSVIVWDRGTWRPDGDAHQQLAKGHLSFELRGSKLKGRWHLVRMRARDKGSKENWLLIKADDEYAVTSGSVDLLDTRPRSVKTGRTVENVAKADVKIRRKRAGSSDGSRPLAPADREKPRAEDKGSGDGKPERTPVRVKGGKPGPLPTFVEPALATLASKPPAGDAWVHEVKFDGYRLLARVDRGRVKLLTRSGLDWTTKFSSLKKAFEALPVVTALLDGEVVVQTERGTPDFAALQADLSEGRSDRFQYYAFDLLHLDGVDLRSATLIDRKAALAELLAGNSSDVLRLSEHLSARGDEVLKHACRLGLEGIVSKLKGARYRSGRSKVWLKAKCVEGSEFVIVGYVPSTTQRRAVGSLALGYYKNGKLIYAGRVGSGFSIATAEELFQRLEPIRSDTPPFAKALPSEARRNVRWARPQLVAEVEMRGWTADGIVRHAVFKGLRQDKPAEDVTREKPMGKPSASSALPVALTHPDRVLWPDVGVTKQGLAEFYLEIWPRISPFIVDRPLTLVRCPGGVEEGCFYQKHAWAGINEHIVRVRDPEDGEELLAIKDVKGLVSLVQASVLEIHVWGAKLASLEKPDGITFDLDPDAEVIWGDVVSAAFEVRDRLKEQGLESFVKTTGGKGLHVYAPLKPLDGWAEVKEFAHQLGRAMAKDSPQKYLATASKKARRRRIFVDYLRNGRGATAVAAYSARARAGAPVSTPLSWDELGPELRPDRFTVLNLLHRLAHIDDPWRDVLQCANPLRWTASAAVGSAKRGKKATPASAPRHSEKRKVE